MRIKPSRQATIVSRPGSDHVWVSDELLRSTFSCFVRSVSHTHVRHTSHVPGPLEFRKRTAKRRLNHLSSSSQNLPSTTPHHALLDFTWLSGYYRRPKVPPWSYVPPRSRVESDSERETAYALPTSFSTFTEPL